MKQTMNKTSHYIMTTAKYVAVSEVMFIKHKPTKPNNDRTNSKTKWEHSTRS